MEDHFYEVQEKINHLMDQINRIEDDDEKALATIDAIIQIGQNISTNVFELYGILEEAKFIFREHHLGDHGHEDEFVDLDEPDLN